MREEQVREAPPLGEDSPCCEGGDAASESEAASASGPGAGMLEDFRDLSADKVEARDDEPC
ncbi:MAG: hypothetical protein V5A14_03190 [Desulfohalobiaceae bacterium]